MLGSWCSGAPVVPQPCSAGSSRWGLSLALLCLQVAYDGSEFHGWQRQRAQRTVHGTLQAALRRCHPAHGRGLLPTHLVGCSRTDRGVHAEAQVAHVDLHEDLDAATLLRRCNGRLPGDVRLGGQGPVTLSARRLVAAEPVAADFHVRSSALLKPLQAV